MNLNFPLLIQLLATAVATVATAQLTARLYARYLKVEAFRYRIEFNFNHAVLYNDQLQDSVKLKLIEAFQNTEKSFSKMLFSNKPLKISAWYNEEERDAFFTLPLAKI